MSNYTRPDQRAIQAQCTQCKRTHTTTIADYETYVGGWLCRSCRASRNNQPGGWLPRRKRK